MQNNYYFLKQLSHQLREELIGYRFGEVFSQAKNELIIALFSGHEEKYIKVHLDPSFCCLSFPKKFQRARRNSIDLFRNLEGLEIIDVIQLKHDRSFYFQCSMEFQLLLKMHGNRSNVILLHEDEVIEVFRNGLKQDLQIHIPDLNRYISLNEELFGQCQGNYKKIFPTLGKAFDPYFKSKNYDQLDRKDQYQCLVDLIKYLDNPRYFIHQPDDGGLPVLTLYKIKSDDLIFKKPIEALNAFFITYISTFRLQKEKSRYANALNANIKKGIAYVTKSKAKLERLKSTHDYRHVANLIMANLHAIKPHSNKVELIDFYSRKPVKISLKAHLSPQLNAEKYYKKARKQQIEIDTLTNNIIYREAQIDEYKSELEQLHHTTNFKLIEKKNKSIQKPKEHPYFSANVMDYEVLIGKNATKNELLTFRTAKKEDLFLHVKDAPGSHVIIRKKANQNFPRPVIERAASYAAFYSKNKSESLCRVLYTPRKYVRKSKKGPAGTIIVEREQVILVTPQKPPDQICL